MCLVSHVAEVFLTAYQAIAFNGHLEDGNAILIHAVSIVYLPVDTEGKMSPSNGIGYMIRTELLYASSA